MVGLSINDAILAFALIYSSIDIFTQWNSFASCCHPIQLWLVISYATIILFRIIYYISQYISEDSEDFLPSTSTSGVPFWLNLSILCIIFPFFVSWTIVGTIWFKNIELKTPQCLPRNGANHPWFLIFWLILCYVWIAMYSAFIGISVFFEFRIRRAEEDLQLLENEEIVRRWGRLRLLADYGIHFIRHGLSPVEVSALPVRKVKSNECIGPCSICIEDFKAGDAIRTLPACGHSFHKSCIDTWLLRNAICPNCKTLVRYGKTETGTTPTRFSADSDTSMNQDTISTTDFNGEDPIDDMNV
ncbi:zinc finger, C3HC4 type domain-containing protein [Cryptosporidium muris RN66]|uniref:Zinc finger, C3HC4 type domain-containing protein n=1 Tax=Cryptosporidium muris (strain RN66) TaxID=441375 RepID=B6AF67_CRYMR|nr:zinc finger, C3HC4 type domain-containing protein [Cryptosporidium muris RN66]EEA06834.1 zinc finger, C3HC4 type domain-containing protein [Cryptosporidium muris RN66]|eukprot:XP_002141183.1 zinc finger, C3HC4 type domain-containing protein [Cryptosporidium muris RN66]